MHPCATITIRLWGGCFGILGAQMSEPYAALIAAFSAQSPPILFRAARKKKITDKETNRKSGGEKAKRLQTAT
jgi:hypothetical protein